MAREQPARANGQNGPCLLRVARGGYSFRGAADLEFLSHAETLRMLSPFGVTETREGGIFKVVLGQAKHTPGTSVGAAHALELSEVWLGEPLPDRPDFPAAGNGAGRGDYVSLPRSELPVAAMHLIHKAKLDESVLIPSVTWRPVLDTLAFDPQRHEDWLEVDADAALHQNGRDPLLLVPHQLHIVERTLAALIEGASGPEHGLTLVSATSPFVLEFAPPATLRVQFPSPMRKGLLAKFETDRG